MSCLAELRKEYREAKIRYENNPTPENEKAMMGVKETIGLVIGVLVIAYVLPSALQALAGANTTGLPASEVALFGVIGLVIIAIVIMKVAE